MKIVSLHCLTAIAAGAIALAGCSETPQVAAEASNSESYTKASGAERHPDYRGSWAQVPVILSRIQPPSFPELTLDVTQAPYGADAGGDTDSRPAIQRAIVDISRFGGGTVRVPPGRYFVDGPLHLENNVNLHLEEDAEIVFGTNYDKFLPQVLTRYEGTDVYNFSPLIYVYQKHNVAITGSGTFNGQSENSWSTWVPRAEDEPLDRIPGSVKNDWELASRQMNNNNVPVFERRFERSDNLRTDFALFYDSENILLGGVHFVDSPFWVAHFYMSRNITVRNTKITSLNKNNDGIDIESSEDVHIHDIEFRSGDDCIAIKSGRDLEGLRKMIPSRNIVVQNANCLADDMIALGSEASGGVRNVFIENSTGENLRKGFYLKANRNRGNQFEHIRMRNLTLGDLADVPENRRKLNMFEVTTNYDSIGVEYFRQPLFKDIRWENVVTGESRFPFSLEGTRQSHLRDFVFDSVHLGAGEEPNKIAFVEWPSMYFRDVTVAGEPLTAMLDESTEPAAITQVDNIPPDVYAGEDQLISLAAGNVISFDGDVIDADHDPMTFSWEIVPADAEPVSQGEDEDGNTVNFRFGDESTVSISNPNGLSTQVEFSETGIFRIRLTANDRGGHGYHTVFVEVRP